MYIQAVDEERMNEWMNEWMSITKFFLFFQESVGVEEIVTYHMIGMVSAKAAVLTSVTNRVLSKATSVREKTLQTTSTD